MRVSKLEKYRPMTSCSLIDGIETSIFSKSGIFTDCTVVPDFTTDFRIYEDLFCIIYTI